MEGGGLGLLKAILPQVPGLSYAAFQHSIGATPTSKFWDLRTEMTVAVLRRMMTSRTGKPPSITKIQGMTLRDPGVKGKMWVAKATMQKPAENDVRDLVVRTVEEMKEGPISFTSPESADVPFEWTTWRSEAGKDEALPEISEQEKYTRLMAEPTRTSDTTILYFHGGAYYLCGNPTHRAMVSLLAKEAKGRVASIAYRLAPQTAFPGQLLDAFTSYLNLLYPPPGSFHEAVRPEHIVLAGDSAGGNLSIALLQFLLQLHRSSGTDGVPIVKFNGRDVHVPLPAGATANSGWFDIARALPSIQTNADFDYLPGTDKEDVLSTFPSDEAWPADPPRGDLFCDLSLLDHPLVSPVVAPDWARSPPLWFCAGREMLYDEVTAVASRAAQQGVRVQFEMYEAMPHCFQLLMPHRANSARCLANWGDFCRRCVEEPATLRTVGVEIRAKGGEDRPVDVLSVGKVGLDEAKRLVRAAKEKRLAGYEKEGKAMPKPSI